VALFAYLALEVLAAGKGGVAAAGGRMQQARLLAAADAGLSLAIHGLAAEDRDRRWSLDGRPRDLVFDGVDLTITVEDERGKAALAGLNDSQARALFAGAGASGERLDALVTEFRDWQSETAGPSAVSTAPPADDARHGAFRTVGELAALKDMDAETFARIAPVVTVFFEESGPFEPSHAQPLAKAAMSADTAETPDRVADEALIASQTPDETIGPDDHLQGRTLTVRVLAQARDGSRAHRTEIVELTGDKARPFWVRYAE
jgi:general secretion pathway protein K